MHQLHICLHLNTYAPINYPSFAPIKLQYEFLLFDYDVEAYIATLSTEQKQYLFSVINDSLRPVYQAVSNDKSNDVMEPD